MKKTKTKKPVMEKPEMEIMTPAHSEELELRFLNACTAIHAMEEERKRLFERIEEEIIKVRELEKAERERLEKQKAAWKFAGKMGLAFLFACGCAASIAGCMVSGPWWTAIAPMVLFLGGLWAWLRWI